MPDKEKTIKAHCNKCIGNRNHLILHVESQDWDEEIEPRLSINGNNTYQMLKCCGCDSVKLRHTNWMSESYDEFGRPYVDENYYPPATSRPEPKWLNSLSRVLRSEERQFIVGLLKEIYSALHNNSRRLAVMGVRALLEHIMVIEVGDQGTFTNNLNEFQTKGNLSTRQRELIEPILDAGHATMHRGFHPTIEDVITVVEIAESLVETTYVHSQKASKLKSRVPQRKKTSSKKHKYSSPSVAKSKKT